MTHRAARLAARREQLLARSERLRLELAEEAAQLAGRFRLLDAVAAFARSGTGRLLLCGGAALVLVAGPGRALKLTRRLVLAWPILRPLVPRALHQLRAWRERAGRGTAGDAARDDDG